MNDISYAHVPSFHRICNKIIIFFKRIAECKVQDTIVSFYDIIPCSTFSVQNMISTIYFHFYVPILFWNNGLIARIKQSHHYIDIQTMYSVYTPIQGQKVLKSIFSNISNTLVNMKVLKPTKFKLAIFSQFYAWFLVNISLIENFHVKPIFKS